MEVQIKKMVESDLPRVLEIEKGSFTDPWSLSSFQREVKENPYAVYLTGFIGDVLAAYIGGWIVIDELHITNLAVSEKFRHRGIAKKLIEKLTGLSKKRGVRRATLEVRVSNDPAVNLYKGIGFSSVGKRPHYYSDGEDALIMWKELGDD